MLTIILAALAVLIIFLYYHVTKYNNFWKDRNVPGPEPFFLFGNLKDFILRRKPLNDVVDQVYRAYPNEKFVGIFTTRTPTLLLRDLDTIKNVMIKNFDAFVDREVGISNKGLGCNMFRASGDTWRVLRYHFTPLFTSGKLKNMMYLMEERGDKFTDYIDRTIKTHPEQEVHALTQKFTQATIAACAFGLDINTFDIKYEMLQKIDQKIFTVSRGSDLEMMYPGISKKIGFSSPKEITDFFFGLTKEIIAERNGEPSNRNDFMDLILTLRKNKQISGPKRENDLTERTLDITDSVIAAQAFVFYAAGYETSASTMGFMLYQLALNADIQDKLIAEIDEVLEKHDGKITLQTVSDLNYMSKVFDETLRMYPIASTLRRCAVTEYKIPGTDLTIPKGQLLMVPVSAIHHDEAYYPNPEVFDPERFSAENVAARHSCAFLPFGLGPRNCIGMRFAQVQSKVCIAKLLSKFRVEPSKNTPRNFEYDPTRLVLYPKGGFLVNIVKRH